MKRIVILTAALGLALAPARAQEPSPQQRLLTLLQALHGTDPKAWSDYLAGLEQQAKAHDARAAQLRQQAKDLEAQAVAADQSARALRAEAERLAQVQKLLGSGAPPAAGSPPAEPPKDAPKDTPKDEAKTQTPAEPPKDMPKGDIAAPDAPADAELVTWTHVEPIFRDHCTSCHNPDDNDGGFDVTSFAAALQGGGSGKSIVPGEPEQSRLIRMVTRQERPFMPRNADPLAPEVVAKLRRWIEHGAAADGKAAAAFLKKKAAAAKDAAAEDAADEASGPPPLPEQVPATPLRAPDRPAPFRSLVRSPRAPLLAFPGSRQLVLCDTELQPLAVLPVDLPHVDAAAFSPDGSIVLAIGGAPGRSGAVAAFDVRTGALLGQVGKERDVPLAAAVHPGRGLVALGGAGKQVRVLRLRDGGQAFAGKHDDFVLALAFTPDGQYVAAADRSGEIRLWDCATGRLEQTLTGHRGAVHGLACHRRGRLLASAGADGTVRLWDVLDGKEKWRQGAHDGQCLAVAFGPDDAVASCGSDGRIRTFSLAGRNGLTSPPVGEWLYAVAFGESSDVIFAGDWQGRVHRYQGKGKKLSATVPLAPPPPTPQ